MDKMHFIKLQKKWAIQNLQLSITNELFWQTLRVRGKDGTMFDLNQIYLGPFKLCNSEE